MSSDGGPAFPHVGTNTNGGINVVEPGMTLRDYFAGQALVGILISESSIGETSDAVAVHAYEYADSMMSFRNYCSDCGRNLSEAGGGDCQICEERV